MALPLLAASVVAGLAGCAWTAAQAVDPSAAAAPVNTTGSPATAAELPAGIIGSAKLTGLDGADLGLVEFIADGSDEVEARLDGVPTDPLHPRDVLLSPRQLGDDETCFDNGLRFALGSPDRPGGWAGVVFLGGVMMGDPGFLDEVVLTSTPVVGEHSPDCLADVVGRGSIEWTFEPLRSGIRAVDSGSTGGARGGITVEDGGPVAYEVVEDDLIDEVAARFALTRDDLFYLNPSRMPSPQSITLRVGEVLNLSLARR